MLDETLLQKMFSILVFPMNRPSLKYFFINLLLLFENLDEAKIAYFINIYTTNNVLAGLFVLKLNFGRNWLR